MKRWVLVTCLLLIGLVVVSAETKDGVGGWVTNNEADPFSDEAHISLFQKARDGRAVYLVVRLRGDKLDIYIEWNRFITTDDNVEVLSRIDKDQAQQVAWGVSTSQEATFFQGDTVEMLLRMMRGTILATRVIPYGETPVVAVFDLTGLKETMSAFPSFVQWVSSRAPAATE